MGYFGASTGAAAALSAAASQGAGIRAVVSRGGRPDLAPARDLARVQCPTLLLVGACDEEVLALNRCAVAHMPGPTHLTIVPGATHLFEEPGTLEAVARLAADWFAQHLPTRGAPSGAQ
jgi:pimeloyl-ACP methyl ester carboxylesterase